MLLKINYYQINSLNGCYLKTGIKKILYEYTIYTKYSIPISTYGYAFDIYY